MIVLGTQKDTIIKGFELAGVVDALVLRFSRGLTYLFNSITRQI